MEILPCTLKLQRKVMSKFECYQSREQRKSKQRLCLYCQGRTVGYFMLTQLFHVLGRNCSSTNNQTWVSAMDMKHQGFTFKRSWYEAFYFVQKLLHFTTLDESFRRRKYLNIQGSTIEGRTGCLWYIRGGWWWMSNFFGCKDTIREENPRLVLGITIPTFTSSIAEPLVKNISLHHRIVLCSIILQGGWMKKFLFFGELSLTLKVFLWRYPYQTDQDLSYLPKVDLLIHIYI